MLSNSRSNTRLPVIFLGFLIICLAGCAAAPAQPTATHIPSPTPNPTQTTAPTPTLLALHPIIQTDLPTPTLTPTRTPTHGPTETPGPNWETLLAPTETIPAIIATDMPDYALGYAWWHSPNGKWLVENMNFVAPALRGPAFARGSLLRVVRVDGKVEWKVDFLGNQATMSSYRPVAWSGDGNFVYIAYRVGTADGPGIPCDTNGLRRLDVRNGALTSLLESPEPDAILCWNYAFSPDTRKLAYVPPDRPKQLLILDLSSGKKLSYELAPAYVAAGQIRWSPDQKQLLVMANQEDESKSPAQWKSSLFWVKIEGEKLNVQPAFEHDGFMHVAGWQGDRVEIELDYAAAKDQLYWEVSLSGKKAIQITPTPQPQ